MQNLRSSQIRENQSLTHRTQQDRAKCVDTLERCLSQPHIRHAAGSTSSHTITPTQTPTPTHTHPTNNNANQQHFITSATSDVQRAWESGELNTQPTSDCKTQATTVTEKWVLDRKVRAHCILDLSAGNFKFGN